VEIISPKASLSCIIALGTQSPKNREILERVTSRFEHTPIKPPTLIKKTTPTSGIQGIKNAKQ
jgi:hypothetical protein